MSLPIRMCIACRKRFIQKELKRLQCIEKEIVNFTGKGRSFYLCKECLKKDKILQKALFRQCKSNNIKLNFNNI